MLAATVLGMPAFADAMIALTADAGRGRLTVPFLPTLTRTITATAPPPMAAEPAIVASVMQAASDAIRENRERDLAQHRATLEALAAQARDSRASHAEVTAAITAAITATHEPTPVHLHAAPITVEAAPAPSVTIEPAEVHVDIAMPEPIARRVVRNGEGQIIGTEPVKEPAA